MTTLACRPLAPTSRAPALPWWTITFCASAILIPAVGAEGHFQYDRRAVLDGQWWRTITGHWTHWSADHLLWDVVMIGVLGWVAERRGRGRFIVCVFGAAAAVSAGVWLLRPDVQVYRGLSGIDSALFALVAAGVACDSLATRRRATASLAIAALVSLAAKLTWEIATGSALFVDATASGFEPLPLAHALGAATGAATGAAAGVWKPMREETP